MIISSCVYLQRDGCWLMLYRNKKKNDVNHNKWIGVGGKKEKNESIAECAVREVFEETGYTVETLKKEGDVFFHYPTAEAEHIVVYSSTSFHGRETGCNEGTLAWIKETDLMKLDLWEGDRIFMRKMLKQEPFVLTLSYNESGELISAIEGKTE